MAALKESEYINLISQKNRFLLRTYLNILKCVQRESARPPFAPASGDRLRGKDTVWSEEGGELFNRPRQRARRRGGGRGKSFKARSELPTHKKIRKVVFSKS